MKKQMRRHMVTAAALLVLGSGAAPFAQDQDRASEFQSWRTPGWSFTPGVTLGTVFDSNVALASAPADTRQTQSDRLILAQPFAHLEFFSPRTEFSTGYQGDVRRYADVSQLNGFDQRVYGSVRRLVSRRVTLFARNSYADVPTTDEVEVNGVPFSRTGSRMNAALAGVDARLTKYTDLSVRYENTWVKFDRQDTFLTGGWLNGARAELSHHLNDRLSAGAEYGIRFADLNEGTHQLTFQDAGGTLHYDLGPGTNFSLAGGVSHLDDHLLAVTRTGPYVRMGVTHDAHRAVVGASFERTFVPSFGFGGSSQSEEVRGFVRMPLQGNRVYVESSAAWRRSNPFVSKDLVLDTIWVRSTVGYSAARWFRVEGFYAFARQDSQVTGGEINRQRIGAQVVVSQPMRIR